MLWKKETSHNDACYVDIFAEHGGKEYFNMYFSLRQEGKPRSTVQKSDAVSLKMRIEGNECFNQGKWTKAIELYGESLCYAENGSKNVSLAYANRSACFLKLKQYNECLIDIELAKEAGYPAKLMPKLNRRKDECLKAIEEGKPSVKIGLELSMAANEHFPCMANVLEFDRDDKGNLGVFAKEDIDVGQTIVVEKGLVNYLYWRPGWKCNICLKGRTNLVPCKKCTVAMFCRDGCQSSSLHEYECGIRYSDSPLANATAMRIVRSCLMAIDLFPSVEELMTFVERAISTDRNQIPSHFLDEKSRYEAFLKLPIDPANQYAERYHWVLEISFTVRKMLLKIPKINSMFKPKKYHRFLMHFVMHHYQMMQFNSIIASKKPKNEREIPFQTITSQTGLMTGHTKHSCSPNVMTCDSPVDTIGMMTVQPVMKGQQIFYSQISKLLTLSAPERRKMLWQERKRVCKCARCEGVSASKTLCKRIRSDPDYQYITSQSTPLPRNDDDDDADGGAKQAEQTMIEKCERFLRKYGQKPWSIEFGRVVLAYMEVRNRRAYRE